MGYLKENCSRVSLRNGKKVALAPFSCGDEDLDGFFAVDYIPFEDELMGKTYCYVTDEPPYTIVAAFTVSNASIHNRLLTSSAKKHISENVAEEKRSLNYPAVLIGRLGVNQDLRRKNIGSELMDIIKNWFVAHDNKTGCRYLLVDAYNRPETLNYYLRNGFNFIFNNLESEKRYRKLESIEGELRTRLMYFDLILTKQENP